jgi:hypothetical protein
MPNGTASPQLPIRIGRMNPSTRYSQIAEAKPHATCVPIPSALARRKVRHHQSRIDALRKNPAISHHPPWFRAGMDSPPEGGGGSSASQGNWRTNSVGLQSTEANMLSPMISNAMTKQIAEAKPSVPR